MAKYDFDFKLKVVKSYLNGDGGYSFVAKKYGIPNMSQVQRWVRTYNALGKDGLKRKNKHTSYTVQFKLDVIDYMTRTKASAQEVANHFRIENSTLVSTWKCKFEDGGIHALSKMKGRPPMNNNKYKEKNLTREQELERENELLKAELAFLKKLRASGMNIPERLKTNTKQK
jgi:transposase